MIRLIYVSTATSLPTESELTQLLEQARSRNLRQNITGMLLYDSATYMQVLEGKKADVIDVFNSISKDPRNTAVLELLREPISGRDFPNWQMGFKKLEACLPGELPGFLDVFNGHLDNTVARGNKSAAVNLLLNFASPSLAKGVTFD